MNDDVMTPFERRLSARLRAHAEQAVVSVDAGALAHAVASGRPRSGALWSLQRPRLVLQFAMVVLLLLALVAAALLVGAIQRPSLLGRNGLIAFATNGGIAVANPDGSGVQTLTSGAGEESFPTWSPDGATIAFWSKPSNLAPLSLVVLDPQTGSRTVVSGSLNIQSDPAPLSWAPDGRRLAFPAIIGQGYPEVYVVGVDGSDLRSLAPELQPRDPALSPDGSQIAFRGRDAADLATIGLYVVGVDGTGLRPVATAHYLGVDYAWAGAGLNWSPDGTQIAYASTGSSSVGGYVIAVADVATGATRDLTAGDFDGPPIWSPDGRWIAFGRGPVNGTNAVGLVRPDGTGLRILAGVQILDSTLSWSPDGTHIVAYSPDLTKVQVIPIDGSTPSTFTAPGANTAPSWQRLP